MLSSMNLRKDFVCCGPMSHAQTSTKLGPSPSVFVKLDFRICWSDLSIVKLGKSTLGGVFNLPITEVWSISRFSRVLCIYPELMNNHPNLISYITDNFPEVQNLSNTNELDEGSTSFLNFLKNTIIIPGRKSFSSLRVLSELSNNSDIKHQSYDEFINNFLSWARSKDGFKLPGVNDVSRSGSTTSNPYLNFQIHVLKDELWARLCDRIGRLRFIELLTGNTCFLYHPQTRTYSCVFGSRKGNTKKSKDLIYKRRMYYRWRWHHNPVQILSDPSEELTRLIFNIDTNKQNLPKKYRKFLRLLLIAKANEVKLKYRLIFINSVVKRKSNTLVFENSSRFQDITRFVFTVIDKTFPKDLFGCSDNQRIMKKKIIEILRSQRLEPFEVNLFSSSLKLSSIRWLGKSEKISSAQDKIMRQAIFSNFLKWFFGDYLLRLIQGFWYVTDSSSESSENDMPSAFFTHETWNKLSSEWLIKYIEKYLIEIKDENHIPSKYNHGILRLIPKKSDFRPLCVPVKLRDGTKDERRTYDRDTIRPVRDILRDQQKKIDGNRKIRCFSVRDISLHLSRFKSALCQENNGKVPTLYGVKFDMKHCYDNLNQAKIIECIEFLFSGEDKEERFYVRNYLRQTELSDYLKLTPSIAKRKHIVNFNIFDYPPSPGVRNVHSDQSRTMSFTRGDVIDIVKDHVLNSTIEMPQMRDKIFTRRIGVFQGFPLLATFCDIVYNSLVDNVLMPNLKDLKSILLRLADDFLFLSVKKEECDEILRLATSRKATDYGAFINNEKCCTVDEENPILHFVGLEVDIRTLNYRRSNILPYKTYFNQSFKTILSHIEWSFSLKLNDFLLDTTIITTDAVLDNVRDIMGLVLDSVKKQMPKKALMGSDEIGRLKVFVLSITQRTLTKIKYINDREENLVQRASHICAQEINQRFGELIDIEGFAK